jgi:hypothetical protein
MRLIWQDEFCGKQEHKELIRRNLLIMQGKNTTNSRLQNFGREKEKVESLGMCTD